MASNSTNNAFKWNRTMPVEPVDHVIPSFNIPSVIPPSSLLFRDSKTTEINRIRYAREIIFGTKVVSDESDADVFYAGLCFRVMRRKKGVEK